LTALEVGRPGNKANTFLPPVQYCSSQTLEVGRPGNEASTFLPPVQYCSSQHWRWGDLFVCELLEIDSRPQTTASVQQGISVKTRINHHVKKGSKMVVMMDLGQNLFPSTASFDASSCFHGYILC